MYDRSLDLLSRPAARLTSYMTSTPWDSGSPCASGRVELVCSTGVLYSPVSRLIQQLTRHRALLLAGPRLGHKTKTTASWPQENGLYRGMGK